MSQSVRGRCNAALERLTGSELVRHIDVILRWQSVAKFFVFREIPGDCDRRIIEYGQFWRHARRRYFGNWCPVRLSIDALNLPA